MKPSIKVFLVFVLSSASSRALSLTIWRMLGYKCGTLAVNKIALWDILPNFQVLWTKSLGSLIQHFFSSWVTKDCLKSKQVFVGVSQFAVICNGIPATYGNQPFVDFGQQLQILKIKSFLKLKTKIMKLSVISYLFSLLDC